jgi:hypothetical protein
MEPKVHHSVHKSPSLNPGLSQFNPVQILLTFSSDLGEVFHSDLPNKTWYSYFISFVGATCPTVSIQSPWSGPCA